MTDDPISLTSYTSLNEDEFELETIELPNLPGPRMLVQMAEDLEKQAELLRLAATLWRASAAREVA